MNDSLTTDLNAQNTVQKNIYSIPQNKDGMPDLVSGTKPLSFFEFWPGWLFYMPMKLYAAFLAIRYGGLTLPTITNPYFDVGGFVGESKSQILNQVPHTHSEFFCKHITIKKSGTDELSIKRTTQNAIPLMNDSYIEFPCVAKPDVGARGAGVQCLYDENDLAQYIRSFPDKETIIIQELADYPFEAGLFYIRKPEDTKGNIFSLTLKYFPYVTGNGTSTLRELIENDPRASKIKHIYMERHNAHLDDIIPDKIQYRIAFAGSHSRGTIFKNGGHLLSEDMNEKWDHFCQGIPEFYFGRFDIRFKSLQDLQNCTNIKIIEINGAGAEATHIWDSQTSLLTAYRTLMKQYKFMFKIGSINKKRGFTPLSLKELLKLIKYNEQITKKYPHTH